jgi:signal transduction histidine kinase
VKKIQNLDLIDAGTGGADSYLRLSGWGRAVWTGTLAGLSAIALSIDLGAHLLAAGYRLLTGYPIAPSALTSFADFIGGPGAVLFLGIVTSLYWALAERVRRRVRLKLAIVCGLAAALTVVATIQLRWPPVLLWEVIFYHVAGVSGGVIGSGIGRLLYKWLHIEEENISRAQLRLAVAREADEVAEILGVELGGKNATSVALLLDDRTFGVWTAQNRLSDATDLLSLLSEESLVFDGPWVLLRVPRTVGKTGSVLVVPLTKAQGLRDGALAVRFSGRCASRVRRRFLVTAPAAGLALRVRENERRITVMENQRRFARLMHDGCKQDLLGTEMHLALVRQHLKGGEVEAVLESLGFAEQGIRRAKEETNALVNELRPVGTSINSHLGTRIAELGKRIERESGLKILVDIEEGPKHTSATLAEELTWVAREAMANVVRHARATKAQVRLLRTGDAIALEIWDDGVGFDPMVVTKAKSGYGLTTMRERTEELGGTLLIDSSAGGGTSVLATVPATPASNGLA